MWKCVAVERAWYPVGRLDPLTGRGEVTSGEFKPSEPIGGNDGAIELPLIGDKLWKETYEWKSSMTVSIGAEETGPSLQGNGRCGKRYQEKWSMYLVEGNSTMGGLIGSFKGGLDGERKPSLSVWTSPLVWWSEISTLPTSESRCSCKVPSCEELEEMEENNSTVHLEVIIAFVKGVMSGWLAGMNVIPHTQVQISRRH